MRGPTLFMFNSFWAASGSILPSFESTVSTFWGAKLRTFFYSTMNAESFLKKYLKKLKNAPSEAFFKKKHEFLVSLRFTKQNKKERLKPDAR